MRRWNSTQGFIIVEVYALCFEEFLPKAVEWEALQNRLARREPVS
jgi:hypothetical protein